jgi:hypothetical protein
VVGGWRALGSAGFSAIGFLRLTPQAWSHPLNPELLASYDEETRKMWQHTRVADRAEAIIAHELAEHQYGGDDELALIAGPETKLPISHAGRELVNSSRWSADGWGTDGFGARVPQATNGRRDDARDGWHSGVVAVSP